MASNGSSKTGCAWITVVIGIVGALFFFKIVKPEDLPGLDLLTKTAADYSDDGGMREEETSDPNEVRTWTSITGSTVEASVVEVTGTEVKLQKQDGVLLTVQRKDFSDDDRLFLSRFFGSEGEMEIPKGKPRVRTSATMKSWNNRVGRSHFARGAISLQNGENYRLDEAEVFWTWAQKSKVKMSLGSNSRKIPPVFHSGERTHVSLGALESVIITTSQTDAGGRRAISINDCLIVQVYVDGELVSSDASQSNYQDWAENPDLPNLVSRVKYLSDPEITNSLGNPR
jgi:hypothetical protein